MKKEKEKKIIIRNVPRDEKDAFSISIATDMSPMHTVNTLPEALSYAEGYIAGTEDNRLEDEEPWGIVLEISKTFGNVKGIESYVKFILPEGMYAQSDT